MPDNVQKNQAGHLQIGGVDSIELAQKYGTPVIAYDTSVIKQEIAAFKKTFLNAGIKHRIVYASKAFSSLTMYRLLSEYDT